MGGIVVVAATNPFFGIQAIGAIQKELKRRKWKQLQNDMYYLKRRGFVEVDQNPDGSYVVKVTATGKRQAWKYNLDDILIPVPKKWDGKWRIAMFDIPTTKQKARLALLARFKELGFVMLQRSIWAHPFECREEVAVLARAFGVERYLHYLVCTDISAAGYLRREFEQRNLVKLS